ncbi:MAG TPA: NADH-quinone oxidoreductase subunit C [Candidatus Thermoplasmatota archaeon]|nr:NADH-quinone oxidoreductase subunit C [Candidatus Thermoplasmatota archaeon]
MALPDAGNVEDFTQDEMMELVKLNETDKTKLTKLQKAAIARYNFKKNKGEPIPFKGSGIAAPAPAPASAPAPAAGAADIISLLSPEMQALAARDPATLTKEEKIALAKSKSQAVKAQAASGAPAPGAAKPSGPSPEELAAKKALGFAHAKELHGRFESALEGWSMQTDKPYAIVKSDRILDVVTYLHMEMGFDQIRDLTATDYPPDRLEVVYNLYRHMDKAHMALKVKLGRAAPEGSDLPSLPSITSVYMGADWLEREVFDLLGIRFTGHPYMRRLMMPDDWVGHPLRKDYDVKKEQFIGLDERGNDIVSFDSTQGW